MRTIYTTKIRLHTIPDLNNLSKSLTSLYNSQIDASIGSYKVDAHSVMGLMYISALDHPIDLTISEICPRDVEKFKEIVRKYEVIE